jgi:hypothetical protein
MKHLAFPVDVRRIDAIQKKCMNVRVAPEVAGGALNDRDGTALPAGQTTLGLALAVPRISLLAWPARAPVSKASITYP